MHFTTPSFEYALNVVPEIPLSTINFYIAYIGITEVICSSWIWFIEILHKIPLERQHLLSNLSFCFNVWFELMVVFAQQTNLFKVNLRKHICRYIEQDLEKPNEKSFFFSLFENFAFAWKISCLKEHSKWVTIESNFKTIEL